VPASSRPAPVIALLGGVLYGVGMVLAGGCLSRAWLRAASGSAEALVLIGVALAVAVPTSALMPEPVPVARSLAPGLLGFGGLILAAALGLWVLGDGRFRARHGPWRAPAALGVLLALALTVHPGGLPWPGLTFVPLASADALVLVLLLGVVAGAAWSARRGGRWRWEAPAWREPSRQLSGAVLLGLGAALAGGGSVAVGVTGVAVLAPAALAALAGMIAGALLTLKMLLAGGPAAVVRAVAAGAGWRG
jgi:uncharacterized membrane protein YedE/YeeE